MPLSSGNGILLTATWTAAPHGYVRVADTEFRMAPNGVGILAVAVVIRRRRDDEDDG